MSKRYRVGIDVGLNSVGLSAIEIDDSDDNPYGAIPMKLLSSMSIIHDGGIDPDAQKSADSRKSCSGIARRARHLNKRRAERLKKLDGKLSELGYDLTRAEAILGTIAPNDPYYSWKVRAASAHSYIPNETERSLAIAVSVRSVARHRGWRNPFSSIHSLAVASEEPSSFYTEFVNRIRDANLLQQKSHDFSSRKRLTPSELIEAAGLFNTEFAFRHEGASSTTRIPLGKLHQSDYYHELTKIFQTQQVPEIEAKELLELVFSQTSPTTIGAAAKLVAHDELPGQERHIRASKASPAFQKYRIVTTLANLSIRCGNERRRLTSQERKTAFGFLTSLESAKEQPSWHDLAKVLSVSRSELSGIGGQTEDGDPISAKMPPTIQTDRIILDASKKHRELISFKSWWEKASSLEQEMFVELAGNAGIDKNSLSPQEANALAKVDLMISNLDDKALEAMESIRFPSGRAAYSVDSLNRLSERILTEGITLHEARREEFGVEDNWRPSSDPLGTPTGNPSVDRTIRIVSRWLKACVKKWGTPETVNIEHVREGFVSEKQTRKINKEMQQRYLRNQKARQEVEEKLGGGTESKDSEIISRSDIRRWQALQRQNCQCAYCGTKIDFFTSQMDHIVPRKGAGSTNNRSNLVAVCAQCNKSKNNVLFSQWATDQQKSETIDRVKHWNIDPTFPNQKAFREFQQDVIGRLRQNYEDDPIDSRSIESVAWMARTLASQIEGYLEARGTRDRRDSVVHVYKGWITAEARRASGIEGKLPWIGGATGKTRLDRRHHAIDAAVIAILRPGVAEVLAERDSMRRSYYDTRSPLDMGWKTYRGVGKVESLYNNWCDNQMQSLCVLLTRAMLSDQIIVTSPLRLCHSRGKIHADTIQRCVTLRLGDSMSPVAIDKSASRSVWAALTTLPDYSLEKGLPEDPDRVISVHGKTFTAESRIQFLSSSLEDLLATKDALRMPVRNGFADAGIAIHHARIYRIPKSNGYHYAMMRVVACDLSKCHGDLFSYEIPENAISFRFADEKLKSALRDGIAEYIGWLVVNDELVINPSNAFFDPSGTQAINKFMRAFPGTKHFKITGFPQKTKIKLEALQLSSEGLPDLDSARDKEERASIMIRTFGHDDWTDGDIKKIEKAFGLGSGLILAVDKFFSTGVNVIRRSTLGFPRWANENGMPSSWGTLASNR